MLSLHFSHSIKCIAVFFNCSLFLSVSKREYSYNFTLRGKINKSMKCLTCEIQHCLATNKTELKLNVIPRCGLSIKSMKKIIINTASKNSKIGRHKHVH